MEVLGNSSHLKEPEVQVPESNYNCRLRQDINLGVNPNSRSRGETDIGHLVACKSQLSSEVIRWKTETLSVQKERDLARQQNKDLNQIIAKLSERTKELEDRLRHIEDENKHLKSRSVVIDEEKAALVQKLSHSIHKYHSYPCLDTTRKSPQHFRLLTSEFQRSEVIESTNEDWKEVSQKMLQKMKREMKVLEEMSRRFSTDDKENVLNDSRVHKLYKDDELEKDLSNILSDTQSMKQALLHNQQKLLSVMKDFNLGEFLPLKPKTLTDLDSSTVDTPCLAGKYKSSSSRPVKPSDDKNRVYFTKQLETLEDLNKVAKEMHLSPRRQETSVHQDGTNTVKLNLNWHNSVLSETNVEEVRNADARDKVCPICQKNFNATVSQAEFEEHVVNHLEAESASLLDQYVVL